MQTAPVIDNSSIEPRLLSFLERNACDPKTLVAFAADWGNRSYLRVKQGGVSRLIMKCLDEDTGAGLDDFMGIGQWLLDHGLSAPEIYAVERGQGDEPCLVLLEDFGDEFCSDYDLMSDCIAQMQKPTPLDGLTTFLDSPVYEGHRRVVDWFVPCYLGRQNPEGFVDEYLAIWNKIVDGLPKPETAFAHMDFHPANFLYLPERDGIQKCGVIDFQDGCVGPIAYDYTNLLKDIRNDVPQETIDRVLDKVTKGMNGSEKESFDSWYKLLCVQFHFRIAGQVLKMSLVNGRDDLMVYLPRVMRYLDEELRDPMFAELSAFFKKNNVEWNCESLTISSELIASDAF